MYQKNIDNAGHLTTNKAQVVQPLVEYSSVFAKAVQPNKKHNATLCAFISVGTEHCSGAQLKASLLLLDKTFSHSHLVFVVADTLQRFTYQLGGIEDAQVAKQKAIDEGLIWKDQHKSIIEKALTNLTYSFLHWSELLDHNEYTACLAKIAEAYATNKAFKQKFDKSANNFLISKTFQLDSAQAFELCTTYLKEECAAHLVLAEAKINQNKIDYVVYPRNISDAFVATYETFVKDDVLVYLTIRNKPVKQEIFVSNTKNTKSTKSKASTGNGHSFFNPAYVQSNKLPRPLINHADSQTMLLIGSLKAILDSKTIPDNEEKINLLREVVENMEKLLLGADEKVTANVTVNLKV